LLSINCCYLLVAVWAIYRSWPPCFQAGYTRADSVLLSGGTGAVAGYGCGKTWGGPGRARAGAPHSAFSQDHAPDVNPRTRTGTVWPLSHQKESPRCAPNPPSSRPWGRCAGRGPVQSRGTQRGGARILLPSKFRPPIRHPLSEEGGGRDDSRDS